MTFKDEEARAGGDDSGQIAALEQRVARLELEIASLQRQAASGAANAAEGAQPAFAAPPPMPIMPPRQAENPTRGRESVQASSARFNVRGKVPDAASLHSFEDRLGSQIFNRIAIVLLLIGTAYGLKLAVDRGWLGPAERVLIGLAGGAGLVVWSERFRRRGFAAFSYSLKAVGSGVLYLSLWAAFQMFHLLPAVVAMAVMVLVTAWNAYMAWSQDSELLAAYALAGGLATPLLVSTGGDHEIFLFTYLLAIDAATVALVRLKRWPRLLLGAFPATVLLFVAWYVKFFAADALGVTSTFVVLFGAVFGSLSTGRAAEGSDRATRLVSRRAVLTEILLPILNAAFVALALYSVLQDSAHHALLPWLMVVLAGAYLALVRAPQTPTAAAIHLSLAIVFLTIAIPLKASGHWITVGWLVEGLALIWAAARLETNDGEGDAARTLRWLASASLLLGFGGVCTHLVEAAGEWNLPLLNEATGTALTGIAVFAAASRLALRANGASIQDSNQWNGWTGVARGATLLIAATAGLMTLREVATCWFIKYDVNLHRPFRSADFLTALVGLGVLAAVLKASLAIARQSSENAFWLRCTGGTTIAFNLIAVLTGVREVSAVWSASPIARSAEDALQQALAVSAFLMLYGAALLAAGFWRRTAFLRWQALALLVFTICKTFLYDMRSLSQGYRVASVLGLGVLLMTVSFAYQKDWLNLRARDGAEEVAGAPDQGESASSEAAR